MEGNGKITIGRRNCGDGEDYMAITIKDELSKITFVDVEMTMEAFALAISGLSQVLCRIETKGLENVGKKKESRTFEFELTDQESFSSKERAKIDAVNLVPEGWIVDTYFGFQNSLFMVGDRKWARTLIYRYVSSPTTTEEG